MYLNNILREKTEKAKMSRHGMISVASTHVIPRFRPVGAVKLERRDPHVESMPHSCGCCYSIVPMSNKKQIGPNAPSINLTDNKFLNCSHG